MPKVSRIEAELACNHIRTLDLFFVVDDLPAAMEQIKARFSDICELENVNPSMIDENVQPENDAVMEYLLAKTKFDQVLFDRSKEESRRRFFERGLA